jgi:hypothetical protein
MDDQAATMPVPPPWAFRLAAAAVGTGVAAGVGYAAWRAWDRRRVPRRLAATPVADIHEGRWYQLPHQGRLFTSAPQTKELFVSFHDPDTNKPLDSCAGIVAGLVKVQKRRALELAEEGRSRSSSNSRIGSRDGGEDESSLGGLGGLEEETRAYEPEMLYLHPGPLDPRLYSNPEQTPEGAAARENWPLSLSMAEAIRREYHSDIWCDSKFPPSEPSLGKRGDSGTDEYDAWERHKRKVIRWVPLRRLMHQVRGDVVGSE